MANEAIQVYASQVTLEASGASCGSGAFVAADDANLTSANHLNYPEADFALTCDFGAPVAPGTYIGLYRRDLNIDGAADAPVPAATYKHTFVGAFALPTGQSASSVYPLADVPLTKECQFYLENKTAQTMSAGWVLKATPKTIKPAT